MNYQMYNGKDPFEYQKPTESNIHDITVVRDACGYLRDAIEEHVPASAERTLAIRKLEEVSMWANKAIVMYAVEGE